jgi:hypothetical protein
LDDPILDFVRCLFHFSALELPTLPPVNQILEQFDISHSVACVLEEAAAVGGGYRRDGIGDGLA